MRRESRRRLEPALRGAALATNPVPEPKGLRVILAALACLTLIGVFSREISNTDFWWHLKTGEYIWQIHSLPDPDPFAFTTAGAGAAYPGELTVRRFNLTHEWLSQVLIHLTYRVAGFGGVVLARALLLVLFCGLVGLLAYQRSARFYRALAAALAAAAAVLPFATDRPYLATFVFLAATLAILERHQTRALWLLPPLLLLWANCHGGFILGWVAMGAWCAEAAYRRLRGKPIAGDVRLWAICAASLLVSGLNPNAFRVIPVLLDYRRSSLQSLLYEWQPPVLWPPGAFSVLLAAAALVLLFRFRKVRIVDWLLFLAFAGAGLAAGRNTFLIGLLAPILLAAYLPHKKFAGRYASGLFPAAALVLLAAGLAAVVVTGQGFQLRAAEWSMPSGAADFLLANHIAQPMLNTYESGGYLIWRLWPHERVFVDGRALSESVFNDAQRMLSDAGGEGGKTAAQLLDQYGVQVAVVDPFEYTSGLMYMLPPALGNPGGLDWKLVYAGPDAMVFLRHPPPAMAVLDPSQILDTMEAGCKLHIEHQPQLPGCAVNLGHMFARNGYPAHAVHWLAIYLAHISVQEPQITQEYQQLLAQTGGREAAGEPAVGTSWRGGT